MEVDPWPLDGPRSGMLKRPSTSQRTSPPYARPQISTQELVTLLAHTAIADMSLNSQGDPKVLNLTLLFTQVIYR